MDLEFCLLYEPIIESQVYSFSGGQITLLVPILMEVVIMILPYKDICHGIALPPMYICTVKSLV